VRANRIAMRAAGDKTDLMTAPREQRPVVAADRAGANDRNFHGSDCI
jgi:hypothetical protein